MLLEVSNLTVEYGGARAVKGVSLNVSERGFVSIIGANGAGKSSILQAIYGLTPYISGEIRFKGKSLKGLRVHKFVRLGISYVPERKKLFPNMTVLDNLKMGAYSREKKELHSSLKMVLYYFPILEERISQRAGLLSGGEQQMLTIGRGLISKPSLLILDEPSLGLAPLLCSKVGRIIKELNDAGITILLAEQNARMALTLSHEVYVLGTGEVRLSGKTADIAQDESVKSAYLGG
jgi:branched-chain amino acid transport system ATP-binding protein